MDGIRLGDAMSSEQRSQLRQLGTRGLHAQHYHWNSESWVSKETVSAPADALETPLDQIMEEAEEAQSRRNGQAMVIVDPDVTNYVPEVDPNNTLAPQRSLATHPVTELHGSTIVAFCV